nr:unnamed protein product [Callosobruchus analis]
MVKEILSGRIEEAVMRHSELLSYQWLHNGKSSNRYIWYLIYMCIWAFTIYMIYFICTSFMENPTYTTLESFHYPVQDLAMPGISVCNLNKISRKRAEAYAEKLAISTGRNKSDIMNNVTLLGHLYDFSLPLDLGTLETFQKRKRQPSSENHERWSDFQIMFNLTDMTYTTMSTLGSKILISLSTDYPDKASGGLSEEIVNIGVESFIRFDAVTTTTTPEVKNYPIEKRKCIFRDEVQTIFGNYSFSDCIMDCKIKSVIALCQCVPFNYFSVFPRNKWVRLYPIDYQGDGLDLEKQVSLRCPICTAACSDTLYYIDASSVLLHEPGVENVNFSIVNIQLNKNSGISNIHDASFYWYDMIGIFGGICSLTMGLSFISVVEALFLFIYVFSMFSRFFTIFLDIGICFFPILIN